MRDHHAWSQRGKKMRRKFVFFSLLFFLGGCTVFQGVGSSYWHENRLQEIETAYQNEEITEAEYLSLKNETDKIREESIRKSYAYYSVHQGRYYSHSYGYRYSHHYGRHHYGHSYGYHH